MSSKYQKKSTRKTNYKQSKCKSLPHKLLFHCFKERFQLKKPHRLNNFDRRPKFVKILKTITFSNKFLSKFMKQLLNVHRVF